MLTEAETRALLVSSILVLLAAFGRALLRPSYTDTELTAAGLEAAGDVDSALAAAGEIRSRAERRRQPLTRGERIDPNLASEVQLDRLPGIGPGLARAIVRDRQDNGPFRHLSDLERVPGLGSSTVGRLAPHVSLPSRSATGAARRRKPEDVPESRDPRRKLDLNRASQAELEALPGIGPKRASAIVRWRVEHRPFVELEDLVKVPGIGPATLERLRPLAVVRP